MLRSTPLLCFSVCMMTLWQVVVSTAQEAGLQSRPIVVNYSKTDYQGGAQSWDSHQLHDGQILIANDQGLLIFDGSTWQKITLPNRTIMRSIKVLGTKIYVGGQDEIGYFTPDAMGCLVYHSLRELIPPRYLPLQDVWEISAQPPLVHFRSVNRVYTYDESQHNFHITDPRSPIISFISIDDSPYYFDLSRGLVSIDDTTQTYPFSTALRYKPLIEVFPSAEDTLYLTEGDGILHPGGQDLTIADIDTDIFLRKNKVFCAIRLDDKRIAIGSYFGGVAILDNSGSLLMTITRDDGLPSNNIHTLTLDHEGNLWAGTSSGIARIDLNSAIGILRPDGDNNGSYYTMIRHEGATYFGTNNALYKSEATATHYKNMYSKLANTEGQVWGLNIIDGDLLMGHNNGAYHIKNGKAEIISPNPGAWMFVEANTNTEMYVGTYQGIDVYKKIKGKWTFLKKLEGFVESSRFIISIKNNEVWIGHPYRGIFKIIHDDAYVVTEVLAYDDDKGIPSDLGNHIFQIDDQILVCGTDGVHTYDEDSDRFYLDDKYNTVIPRSKHIRRLFQSPQEDLWYLTDRELGKISTTDTTIITRYPNLAGEFVNGFEQIAFVDSNITLIAGYEKVLSLENKKSINPTDKNVLITQVLLPGTPDTIIYGGFSAGADRIENIQLQDQILELQPQQNELVFHYSSPAMRSDVVYAHALVPIDHQTTPSDWSAWQHSTTKEYNNLSSGAYTFYVKGKNDRGELFKEASYTFIILPPWYLTAQMKSVYFLLVFSGLLALIFVPRTKHKKERAALTSAKEQSEAKLEEIQTEKLKAEIEYKNSELASSTMHLVQKNETISKIRKEIQNVSKKIVDPVAKKEVRKILSLLSDDERLEEDWDNFSYHFDQVHTDFLKRISQEFPKLTPKDKKLCAYLRMNLATKEIAPLLNISVRGVEISRYRLRKKLNLENEVNLTDYMMNY